MDKQDVQNIRDDIIQQALSHVTFDGWTWAVVEQSAQEIGCEPGMAKAVFPDKVTDVLDGFSDLADRWMIEALESENPDDLRVRDRVQTAVMKRFEGLSPHKEPVRQSLSFWLIPFRKPRAAKIVWRSADRIWDWAGDSATDYNRYTKRGLLSGILASTTLVWLNDAGEDMSKTAGFLDRRIENVMQFNKLMGKVKKNNA